MFRVKKNRKDLRTKRIAKYIIPGLLALFFAGRLSAQGHDWWANNVNWDGHTHWSRYIVSSPRYMGPNALPIPLQNNGHIAPQNEFRLTGNYHFTEGDQTLNPRLFFQYVLVQDLISFELNMVPFEYFSMSHDIKTERKVFHIFYNSKYAVGDVYLHTDIQLLKAEKHFTDARLRIGYRFPSASMQGAARYTDAPGYYFDVGVGKAFAKNKFQIRPSLMLGFYVWQTNRSDQFQDDAFLFGTAIEATWENFQVQSSFRGYLGYLNDGDRPGTIDLQIERKMHDLKLILGGGLGLWDNLYNRLELGAAYQF